MRSRHAPAGCVALALCAGLLAAATAHGARGRDSAFGYQWRDLRDGATFDGVAFGPSVTFVTPSDDAPPLGPIALQFPLPFYGSVYSQWWISDNGIVTLQWPGSMAFPAPQPLPSAAAPGALLAPFWTDLQVAPAGLIGAGADASGTIERVQVLALDPATGGMVDFDVLAWESGCIQFQYRTAQSLALASVGIENAPGNDGPHASQMNLPVDGFVIEPGQAVELLPPASLALACASALPLPCGTTAGSSPVAGPEVSTWCCGETGFGAHEALYTFTLTEPTEVTLQLTAATALSLLVLDDCNEHACLGSPTTATTLVLGAGVYTVVVDGPSVGEEGPFAIDLSCNPVSRALACPGSDSGTTVGGPSRWSAFGCAPGRDLSGAEALHRVSLAGTGNILATVTSPGRDLDVLVLRAGRGAIGVEDCVAWGDTTAAAWDVPAGDYLVVVDGAGGDEGAYTLDVSCAVRLLGSPLSAPIDLGAMRAQTVSGDTSGGGRAVDRYPGSSRVFDGPEAVHEIILARAGHVVVVPRVLPPGLSVSLARDLNEGTATTPTDGGASLTHLGAGTHYLIVDGEAGAAGPYELRVAYEEPFSRWTSCERAVAPTASLDSSRTQWHFDDGAACVTEPTSYNYPDGCAFALYVNVPCGGSPHLAHFDSESGRLRAFDVLGGRPLRLAAVSQGGWFQWGTELRWDVPDCSNPSDPAYDNLTVDVWIDEAEMPCGPVRIEYDGHAGSTWTLSGECGGGSPPQVAIHDGLRTAVAAHAPLPQLALTAASATLDCPDADITYSIVNTGCAEARDVEVTLLDGATPVATDVVPSLPAGATVARVFSATLPPPPHVLVLAIDPLDRLAECGESIAAGCEVLPGVRAVPLPGCESPCGTPRPDLLPRIGGSLRAAHGPDPLLSLALSWDTDRPLDAADGEHVHVLRSGTPSGGFAPLLAEPPFLQARSLVDLDAARPPGTLGTWTWHYLAFTSDACENDNADFDME